jgi:hypothetical protein
MFPNASQTAAAHGLLTEVAHSMSFQHAVLWVYGTLGVFAVACLAAGYLITRVIGGTNAEFRTPA